MKYLMLIATALFVVSGYVGEANGDEPKAPSRKVIQAPRVQVPNPKFTRPSTQRPSVQKPLPKGFGVPIQRPQGFGKQEWQKPQQPIPQQQPRVQTRHSFGVYNYYYYTPNPYFNRYYRVPAYRPPVIIQPQPIPVYPAPFHGFFFQFRW
jgi:hypothetical protein|tara:strand:+ start:970 stop:1419 length:450 start_codon:yes stop_codon:yes gene_type:complete